MSEVTILTLRHLSKTFPGQVALHDVALDVEAGEVHALCGQNGSGKSTLIKILSGFHEPDAGARIDFVGEPLIPGRREDRARLRFIHQDLGLIDSLDAAENMALGRVHDHALLEPLRRRSEYRAARHALAELCMEIDVTAPVGKLAPVERAMIAIARAIRDWGDGSGLLVLDEPTVSLPLREARKLFEAIRAIRDRGAGVLYVSHHLEEVFELADRVSVLRDGELVMTERVDAIEHADLVRAIVGRALDTTSVGRSGSRGDPRLSVRNLYAGKIEDLSFDLHAGEIVGVTGLIGSGIEHLPEAIFGAYPIDAGSIAIDGEPTEGLTPHTAIERGLALVPTDRLSKGCIPNQTIRENLTLPDLTRVASRLGAVDLRREREDAAHWAARIGLQPGSLERPIGQLSGGNQQKVLIARWLRTTPRILLLHEPTQGVDVGAKIGIHRLIAEAAASGLAVLTVSTDTEELADTADRVVLLDHGRFVDELAGSDLTSHNIAARMLAASTTQGSTVRQPSR